MKNLVILLIMVLVSLSAFAQDPESTVERNAGFHKLTFEIRLNKENYLPLEPLFVTFRVSNQTEIPLAADRPQFLIDSRLKIRNSGGQTTEVSRLTTSSGRAFPLPGPVPMLQPNGYYEEESTLAIDQNLLADSGIYYLQFVLYGGSFPIESNVVELSVENPLGVDKEAFDFLNKNGRDAWFGQVFSKEINPSVLQTFVRRFGDSTYADYAITSLARYYLYKEDFKKAKVAFKKLESSKNNFLIKQSKRDLENIEKKSKEKNIHD